MQPVIQTASVSKKRFWTGSVISALPALFLLVDGIMKEGLFPVFFPIIMGMLIWGGLFLREDRLRALIPLRK